MDSDLEDYVRSGYPRLVRRAYLLTGDAAGAEDLAQDVLVGLWRACERGTVRDLDAYALAALVNRVASRWRGHRRVVSLSVEDALTPTTDGPEGHVVARDELWRALNGLSRRQRAVLVLRHYEGMTESEIAELLEVSVGSVRRHASRGMARMRDQMVRRSPSGVDQSEEV
jgi:RNA polymerase sigma-70 factor (sigma-E family)